MEDSNGRELIGGNPDDSNNVRGCDTESYIALGAGISAYDWEHPSRVVRHPPELEYGPLTELHLAPSPAAAVFGAVLYKRNASPERPILEILQDVKAFAIYRVRAPGVRIMDASHDARLVDGYARLRLDGEQAQDRLGDRTLAVVGGAPPEDLVDERRISECWMAVGEALKENVVALELPDEGVHRTLKVLWPLLGSARRLDLLAQSSLLVLEYQGQSCVGWRDLWRLRDVNGERVGARVFYYVAREAAHDFISLTRKKRILDWVRFITVVLGFVVASGKALGWLQSLVF